MWKKCRIIDCLKEQYSTNLLKGEGRDAGRSERGRITREFVNKVKSLELL
jgi:hypothetical protein